MGKYHFVVCMNTNGTMISEEVANLLAESKISRVAVSVDSCNPALHEKMRGVRGCFQHTYKAIDWLLEKCPEKLYITCTLTALNCDVESVMNIIEWCKYEKNKTFIVSGNCRCGALCRQKKFVNVASTVEYGFWFFDKNER